MDSGSEAGMTKFGEDEVQGQLLAAFSYYGSKHNPFFSVKNFVSGGNRTGN
jgi:hypothetical protein